MLTIEDVARQPLAQRLCRMGRTADDLAAAIRGQSEVALSRRPNGKNWAAKEITCHLHDTEEVFLVRFEAILTNDEPKVCWAAKRSLRFADGATNRWGSCGDSRPRNSSADASIRRGASRAIASSR